MDATIQLTRPDTLTMRGVRLIVQRGPDRGRALRLEREDIVIGTAEGAAFRLTDPSVSSSHLRLQVLEGGYLAQDLGSTNGSRIDERRFQAIFVKPGDVLELGETRIKLELTDDNVELALSTSNRFGKLLGRSMKMRRLFSQLGMVATEDVTVLLLGETGTGKDLTAEAIHEASRRREKPFIIVDCGSIPANLIESELFGHEKGSFTGATSKRIGAFQAAHTGTLFLDEVGELPRELQSRLLRAIESREVRPVGASASTRVDVRIIAATNRDLFAEVNRGHFREDLFYRLNVATLQVPSLRERPEDIPLLAEAFRAQLTGDTGGTLSSSTLLSLTARSWPGNVRELRNWIERFVVNSTLDESAHNAVQATFGQAKQAAVDSFERQFLTELLLRAKNNVSEAARLAGMDRVYLSRLIRKHQIERG
jgi:two-component system response regulator GlrR